MGGAAGAANKAMHQGCPQPSRTLSTRKHEQGTQQQQPKSPQTVPKSCSPNPKPSA